MTSQFHVVFDEWFTMIPSGVDPENVLIPSNWKDLLQFSHYKYYDDDGDERIRPPPLADEWLDDADHHRQR